MAEAPMVLLIHHVKRSSMTSFDPEVMAQTSDGNDKRLFTTLGVSEAAITGPPLPVWALSVRDRGSYSMSCAPGNAASRRRRDLLLG